MSYLGLRIQSHSFNHFHALFVQEEDIRGGYYYSTSDIKALRGNTVDEMFKWA